MTARDDEATALREYGRRAAIAAIAWFTGESEGIDLDELAAIVASVPVPVRGKREGAPAERGFRIKQTFEPRTGEPLYELIGDEQPPESAPTSDPLVFLDTMSHDLAMQHVEDIAAADAAGYLRGEVAGLEKAEKVCDGLIREGSRVTHPGAGVVRVEIRALIAAAQSKEKP